MNSNRDKLWLWVNFTSLFLFLTLHQADAVPSFARQTNLACNTCHTIFPELNSFGRNFKLNGYTLTSAETIENKDNNQKTNLKILKSFPLSAMLQVSHNYISKKEPSTGNNVIEFPQQLSFFFAGEITPHVGSFIQITYDDQGAEFGWDNTDIRFANQTRLASKNFNYGLSLNNNPTVQDLWNTTPAWGFPYASSAVAPTPAAATIIDGGLAQEVVGLGIYAMWNNLIYGEATAYRSSPQGGPFPPDSSSMGTINGASPYLRLALQHQWAAKYLEIGAYGLFTELYPIGVGGKTDDYQDIGIDLQYEQTISQSVITAHATWINEKQELHATYFYGGSANRTNHLNTFRANLNYYILQRCGLSLAYFSTTGDADRLIYSPGSVFGSRTGSPNSDGLIGELQYLPWLNTKLAVQYVWYNKFNGSKKNYDGSGRNASDNNTLYILAWIVF